MPVQLTIYDQRKPVASYSLSQPIEIGRQDMTKNEPAPQPEKGEHVARVDLPDRVRLIIAGALEKQVSRQHLRLEPQGNDKVLVTNLSANVDLSLGPHGRLAAKESRICDLPLYCDLLVKAIRLEGETRASEEFNVQSLAQPALAPGRHPDSTVRPILQALVGSSAKGLGSRQSADDVLCWLQGAMDVLQSAASSPDYLLRAATAAVRLIDLDVVCVLQRQKGEWQEARRSPLLRLEPLRLTAERGHIRRQGFQTPRRFAARICFRCLRHRSRLLHHNRKLGRRHRALVHHLGCKFRQFVGDSLRLAVIEQQRQHLRHVSGFVGNAFQLALQRRRADRQQRRVRLTANHTRAAARIVKCVLDLSDVALQRIGCRAIDGRTRRTGARLRRIAYRHRNQQRSRRTRIAARRTRGRRHLHRRRLAHLFPHAAAGPAREHGGGSFGTRGGGFRRLQFGFAIGDLRRFVGNLRHRNAQRGRMAARTVGAARERLR